MHPTDISSLLNELTRRLADAGISLPRREARLILAHALGLSTTDLIVGPERYLSTQERDTLDLMVGRRSAREPLSRIIGRRGFWSFDLAVSPHTLDPRPDTETLIEVVLARLPAPKSGPLRVLDIGTGSGAILLALLSERDDAIGIGVDISPGALATASGNAQSLGLRSRALFVQGDGLTAMGGPFEVIVSNPPYIPSGDIPGLDPEVRLYDPHGALDGGYDGLDFYRLLIPAMPGVMKPGALAAVEVGEGQAAIVATLFQQCGFAQIETKADLSGIDRCVAATWPG